MLTWYVAFLFSTTAHEAAHALAALKGGDPTAYLGGQVSLNPVPHIKRSPFGTVVVPILAFMFGGWMIGWASAPYNPLWAAQHPRRAAWMAAAGPAANLAIVVLAFTAIKIGLASEVFTAPPKSIGFSSIVISEHSSWFGLATLLSVLLSLNMILFIFNLFPVPPLDGSSVITLFMSEEMTRKYRDFLNQPAFSFLGIILAWRLIGPVWRFMFLFIVNLVHPDGKWGYSDF
ncbi:MAG: site-2 protease family protein [bacterium]